MACSVLKFDVDQSPDRSVQSSLDDDGFAVLAPCMLPGQVLWIHAPHGNERLLLGCEALVIQGFPVALVAEQINKVPDRFQHDLAGNAMCLLVTLAVVQSSVAALSWRSCTEPVAAASRNNVDDAMTIFEELDRSEV